MLQLQAVSTSFRLSNRTAYSYWLGFNWTMTEQPDYHDRMEPLVKFSLVAPLAISLCFLGAYHLLRRIPLAEKVL